MELVHNYRSYLAELARVARDWKPEPTSQQIEDRCQAIRALRSKHGLRELQQDGSAEEFTNFLLRA